MLRRNVSFLGLLAAFAGVAWSQEGASQGPPRVLSIAREEIKPGRMSPHEKVAMGFVSALAKTKSQSYRLGLTPVSGDDNVVLYLEGFDSYAAVEASRKEFEDILAASPAVQAEIDQIERQGADMHASQKTAFFNYRADLSYRPRNTNDIAQARFMNITTVRIKPGRVADYVDYIKALNAARDKVKSDVHSAVYQVASGAPNGTFLILTTHRSLKEWDESLAQATERQKAIDGALGGEDIVKKRRLLISEIVDEGGSALYAMNPKISRPSPEFVAADASFWSPSKAPAKRMAVKKEAESAKKENPK